MFAAAGNAFCQAARLHIQLQNKLDSATSFVDAGNAYKKADPQGECVARSLCCGQDIFLLQKCGTVQLTDLEAPKNSFFAPSLCPSCLFHHSTTVCSKVSHSILRFFSSPKQYFCSLSCEFLLLDFAVMENHLTERRVWTPRRSCWKNENGSLGCWRKMNIKVTQLQQLLSL